MNQEQIEVRKSVIEEKYLVLKHGREIAKFNTIEEANQYVVRLEEAIRTGVGLKRTISF